MMFRDAYSDAHSEGSERHSGWLAAGRLNLLRTARPAGAGRSGERGGAAVFVSLHSNGSTDVSISGAEAWWHPGRPFGEKDGRLASLLVSSVLASLRDYGYGAVDRGLFDAICWRFSERAQAYFPLFVLGSPQSIERARVEEFGIPPEALGFEDGQAFLRTRATRMPWIVAELLFVSNAADAAVLANEGGREAVAAGWRWRSSSSWRVAGRRADACCPSGRVDRAGWAGLGSARETPLLVGSRHEVRDNAHAVVRVGDHLPGGRREHPGGVRGDG